MKLVILDSYAAVSTDLSLDCLKSLCDSISIYERTLPEDIVKRVKDAELLIINKTPLTQKVLKQCPNVKYIGVFATGYNNINIPYCKKRGIVVSNSPAYSTRAVAQLVFAFLLSFYSMVEWHNEKVHAGMWENCKDFSFYNPKIHELAGKTLGIVGFGNIGKKVARLAAAFDMNILVYTKTVNKNYENENLRFVSLNELLSKSDAVTLHCPLTPQTAGIIDRNALLKMKNTALLINTARGELIHETAAADALNSGLIQGMAADVVSSEPISPNNPLLHARNCIITPHIAWACRESRERLIQIVYNNLKAFLEGNPQNNVAE